MISSYQFSERFDALSVLYGATVALFAFLRTLIMLLIAGAALAAVFAVVVAFWLPICQVVGSLAIIAAFAYVTYPRSSKAVRK